MASIDELKSAVSFRLGVAKPNQFMIELQQTSNQIVVEF